MLEFKEVLFKHGDSTVLEDTSFVVYPGHRAGLVGRNGAGKTTIFEIILRRLDPEEGQISYPADWRIAWLDQNVLPSMRSALDFVIDGDREVRRIERDISRAEARSAHDEAADLYSRYEDAGGYYAEARAGKILRGLGFESDEFGKPHREFSGGWRIRLNLAQCLMTPSDLLLLDEPTNHLDLEATVWLESWLTKYTGTLLTIAHDREFLDRAVDEILHVERNRVTQYVGNYESFERQRAENMTRHQVMWERQEAERARILKFVNRFRANAKKAPMVQSRIKALNRMQQNAPLRAESPYDFRFTNPSHIDNPTVKIDDVDLGYDDTTVVSGFTSRIYPRDRIGVLGVNGTGKSTLIKTLARELDTLRGEITYGDHAVISYFAQHQLEVLVDGESPLKHLQNLESIGEQTARNYLGRWGFSGDDVGRPIRHFSGGEKARLVLALLSRNKASLLLLDEPSNHLDLDMRDALAIALQEYQGAVLLVAHDRHFLRQCVDQFWLVKDGKISEYREDVSAYAALAAEDRTADMDEPVRESARDKRRRRAQVRMSQKRLNDRRVKTEAEIDSVRGEMSEISTLLSDKETFEKTSKEDLNDLLKRHGRLTKRLESLENEWLETVDRLEAAIEGETAFDPQSPNRGSLAS